MITHRRPGLFPTGAIMSVVAGASRSLDQFKPVSHGPLIPPVVFNPSIAIALLVRKVIRVVRAAQKFYVFKINSQFIKALVYYALQLAIERSHIFPLSKKVKLNIVKHVDI